jgi:hypothetical protein
MSFDAQFDRRWETVIKPALASVEVSNEHLVPHRVDLSLKSDAILTDILQSIATARVVFADISAKHEIDSRAIRNANVMYELGIAHAIRQPEEVVLFRSDSMKLEFDVAGVRVHSYDPDGRPEEAQAQVKKVVSESLRAVTACRAVAVETACGRLTGHSIGVLMEAVGKGVVNQPPSNLASSEIMRAITLLLEIGAIQTHIDVYEVKGAEKSDDGKVPIQFAAYRPTSFGHAVLTAVLKRIGIDPQHFSQRMAAKETSAEASPET